MFLEILKRMMRTDFQASKSEIYVVDFVLNISKASKNFCEHVEYLALAQFSLKKDA